MSKIKLFKHQIEALEESKNHNRVAYYFDMQLGLGKTFIGSEKLVELNNGVNLIVCQKSKIDDWIEHFNKYYTNNKWDYCSKELIYDLTNQNNLDNFLANSKASTVLDPYLIIGVINYDLIWRRPELLKLNNFTLLLDESSLIQNSTAKRTKFILKMKPKNVILLSGTPCSGKYEHLWTQSKLLGWDIKKSTYEQQYINWRLLDLGPRMVRIVDKRNPYKNVERLKAKLRENGALFKKTEEVMDLPEQTFINVRCKPIPQYKKFLKDKIIKINDRELVGDTRLTLRLYARMLCGQYNPNKLEALEDLINSTNDRLIIFYNFNEELDQIKSIINDRPISYINGSVKDLTNYENEDDSITLVQYQAGSKGHNLQKANKIIYFSPTEKCEDWMQSIKRIHRIGQKNNCFYYKLITEGTVEEGIYRALERGTDYTDELFREEL